MGDRRVRAHGIPVLHEFGASCLSRMCLNALQAAWSSAPLAYYQPASRSKAWSYRFYTPGLLVHTVCCTHNDVHTFGDVPVLQALQGWCIWIQSEAVRATTVIWCLICWVPTYAVHSLSRARWMAGIGG